MLMISSRKDVAPSSNSYIWVVPMLWYSIRISQLLLAPGMVVSDSVYSLRQNRLPCFSSAKSLFVAIQVLNRG